jgi:hypothetical protein
MNVYENLKKWNNLPYSKATLEVIFDKLLPVLWQDFYIKRLNLNVLRT